jgi:murein DD-endopeptidase MepM/ murein hydrolase activator NlpD
MEFKGEALQSYINNQQATYLSKPGYDVYFYSRFETGADIVSQLNFGNNVGNVVGAPTQIPTMNSKGVTPTLIISSQLANSNAPIPPSAPIITEIRIHNTVSSDSGSLGALQIVNPKNIEYFQPTIGDTNIISPTSSNALPDYDFSLGQKVHRIGTMDTVIIKLKNVKVGDNNKSEVVFRGVVGAIHRKKSATGGSVIELQLFDFSEFLRRITAIPLGFFSTISFSITGRGLVNNLIKYSNRLYTGNWKFLGKNIADLHLDDTIDDYINAGIQGGHIADTSQINPFHQMSVPPFFYLQYSDTIPDDTLFPNQTLGQGINQSTVQNTNTFLDSTAQTTQFVQQLIQSYSGSVNNPMNLSPEDTESIQYYKSFVNSQRLPTNVTKYDVTNFATTTVEKLENYAWIYSDLYLEKGLVSFEHQKPWPVMYNAATRSMREVYFDFAPKISPTATNPYIAAKVSEIATNPNLDDIHPNIGIVKYRLSPCFIPYDDTKAKPGNSEFHFFNITDDQIINSDAAEDEQNVFTSVFGFGSALDKADITEQTSQLLAGQTNGLFVFAHTLDPRIEYRLGYRFMSDHDNKILIPFFMYLTSYVLLNAAQLSMFQETIQVLGNPKLQPGSIVRLKNKNIDYYCTDVQHSWSLKDGYTCSLQLGFGHTSGRAPTAVTGYGNLGDVTNSNAQTQQILCQKKSDVLDQYVDRKTLIGNVSPHCLISALWEYMTCTASDDTSLAAATKESETSHPYIYASEWINPSPTLSNIAYEKYGSGTGYYLSPPAGWNNPPIGHRDSQILNAIKIYNLDKYNVTVNSIKNLIAQESSWYGNALSSDSGYGWFQLTNKQNQITNNDACFNFDKAIGIALGVLSTGMEQACGNNPANATGINWLNGFAYYNGSSSWDFIARGTTQPYVYSVFGASQAIQIAQNQQLPANAKVVPLVSGLTCQTQTPDLKSWPYNVYGPIGMQLSTANTIGFTSNSNAYKKYLLTFNTAMPASVSYIKYLLNKYQNQTFFANQPIFSNVNQNSLLEKAIAAWFSAENPNNVDAGILQNATDQISSLYNQCLVCSSTAPVTISAADTSETQAVFANLKFICPVNNPLITSPFGYRSSDQQIHPGLDLVDNANQGNFPVYAAESGTVMDVQEVQGPGLWILIWHNLPPNQNSNVWTRYYDLSQSLVKVGQVVTRGQQIAQVTSANDPFSNETGPHLHWEIRSGVSVPPPLPTVLARGYGTANDPQQILSAQGNPIV